VNNGDPLNRLDVVIVGDGYTSGEMSAFAAHAEQFVSGFFVQEPFREYQRYFNITRIDVASAESGADHPDRYPAVYRNTAFDASYYCGGIQRLVCVDPSKVISAISILPPAQRDVVLVLVNDEEYGGSGGSVAVASIHPSSLEIVMHELGHTIGFLADEYGGSTCTIYAEPSEANTTAQSDSSGIKWSMWIDSTTPIPTETNSPGFPGLYQGSKYCDNALYRPTYNSKMRSLYEPFEQINTEQLVRRFYNFASPIDEIAPSGYFLSVTRGQSQTFSVATTMPFSRDLDIAWTVDGQLSGSGPAFTLDTTGFTTGSHLVEVVVRDTTPMVRSDPEQLLSAAASWSVDVTATNQAPVVNAGPDQSIKRSVTGTLNGTVSDDGLPSGSAVTVRWTKVSGPGKVTFGAPNALSTSAKFSVRGTYTLRLTATDGQLSRYDQIRIIVW
jgi:IgA Peptidase M64/Bacterial Ig domain